MTTKSQDVELRIRARDYSGKTLGDTEKALRDLIKAQDEQSDAAKKGEVSGKALEDTYRRIEAATKGLINQSALIKTFEAQSQALEQTQAKLTAARTAQEAYSRSLGNTEPTKQQAREMANLEAAVTSAEKAQQRAQDRLTATTAKLQQAGIATSNLADTQRRIADAVGKGNAALERQDAALQSVNTSMRSVKGNELAGTFTAIRGAVLQLVAAYASLQGGANVARGAVEAFNTREGARNQLSISAGSDRAAIDEEYTYVRAQADRIGVEFERAIKGYAKFSAAAKLAGRDRQEIRYIFETFSELGRVANLSTEDLDGVFKALEQITSKGKIQAEELRGQLGDRLFGAFQVAAQSLKDVYPDLDKALKDGVVTSDQLVRIAARYKEIVADQLPAAQKSLAAQQARLNNAIFDFKAAVADAGFADAYGNALAKITEFLKTDDGKKFAENLSSLFSSAADLAVVLLTHLDELKAGLSTVVGLYAAVQIQKLTTGALEGIAALKALGETATTTQKAFFALQALIIGWNIGTYLYDKLPEVRRFGVSLVTGLAEVWAQIKAAALIAFEELPRYAKNAAADILNTMTFMVRSILRLAQQAATALGNTDLAASIGKGIDALTVKLEKQGDRVAEVRAQLQRELAQIRDIGQAMFDDAGKGKAATPAADPASPTPRPDIKPGKAAGPSEGDIKKRDSLIESLTRRLEALDAGIDRAEKKSLSAQLDAVDTQFAALQRDIDKLGKNTPDASSFTEKLEKLKGEKKLQITREFNAALLSEQEAINAKLEQLDAAAGRKDKTDLDARLKAISDSYAATYRDIEAHRQRLLTTGASDEPAQLARERLDAGIAELKNAERLKFFKDEIARREAEVNDLLATRAARIRTIGDQEAAGQLTSADAKQRALDVIATLQPELDRLTASGTEFAASLAGAFDPVKLDEFIARLELARGSGERLKSEVIVTGQQINQMLGQGASDAIDKMGTALGQAVIGTKGWGDAFATARDAFKQFALDFLKQIAQMILRALVLNAIQASGFGGAVAGFVNGAVKHDGGVIGRPSGRSRSVPVTMFANAPRYHSGGIAGLAPGEVPAILKKNEEVLTADSPRNILNGGAGVNGGTTAAPKSTRFVLVDDRSKVAEAMASAEGEAVTMVHLQRNVASLRQMLRE